MAGGKKSTKSKKIAENVESCKENIEKVESCKENIENVESCKENVESEVSKIEEKVGEVSLEAQEESVAVLGEVPANEQENVCHHCRKENPTKRCSKRHSKCLKRMFCNETCEEFSHKKATALVKASGTTSKKVVVHKQKGTIKANKRGDKVVGEFWWN